MKSLVIIAAGFALACAATPPKPSIRVARGVEAPVVPSEALTPARGHQSFLQASGLLSSVDVPLLLYFAFWYLGNYYYNIANKVALKAAGTHA